MTVMARGALDHSRACMRCLLTVAVQLVGLLHIIIILTGLRLGVSKLLCDARPTVTVMFALPQTTAVLMFVLSSHHRLLGYMASLIKANFVRFDLGR